MELTSAVTLISRTSSLGTNQFHDSISSTLPDRRSLVGVCKPLRSSPLAGSVFQADETIAEVKQTTKLKPSRIVSTPDFAPLLIPPPPAKRSRPRSAEGSQDISLPSAPQRLNPDAIRGSTLPHIFFSGNPAKQASTDLGRSASSAQSSISTFPAPALRPLINQAGYRSTPHLRSAFRRPSTVHGCPTTLLGSKPSSAEHSSSVHRGSGDNSWLIANPYEVTPKFTRLGLASPGIVLPLSPREHRRLACRSSKSSIKTLAARISRVRSVDSSSDISLPSHSQQDAVNLPSPSSTKCNLSNPTSGPWSSLQVPESSMLPVASSSTAAAPEGEASDLQYPSASKSDHYVRSVPIARTSSKGPLVRFKNLTLRTFKSSPSLTKSSNTPIIENLTPTAEIRLQREIKIGFLTLRSSSPTTSESTADSKPVAVGAFPPPTSKTKQSVRKFWKSFAFWNRDYSI